MAVSEWTELASDEATGARSRSESLSQAAGTDTGRPRSSVVRPTGGGEGTLVYSIFGQTGRWNTEVRSKSALSEQGLFVARDTQMTVFLASETPMASARMETSIET